MEAKRIESVSYWVDSDDVIVDVSSDWDEFALENGGLAVLREHVVGEPLFRFITGDPTRMLTDTLLQRVRYGGNELTRSYRCDSPEVKRFMEMTVVPDEENVLRLHHKVLKVEPIEPAVVFEFGGHLLTNTVARCSMCNRVSVQGQWQECDEAMRQGHLKSNGGVRVIYSVCGDCQAAFNVSLRTA